MASTTRPIRSNGCFKTNLALMVNASVAFRFEKIINGMVKKVRKAIVYVIKLPQYKTPKWVNK